MAEVSDDFVASLKAVRGEFQNTRAGGIGNRILAHVFSTLFPIVFVGFLIFWSGLEWPLTSENWLFVVFSILTCLVGIMLHRTINSRYVFDEDGVQEFRGSGNLKQTIRWDELAKVEYRESRGIKSFTLITEKSSMHLEYYQSLSEEIAKVENGPI
jgi:hypothetical protein